jgi:hypothetical protein
MNWFGDDEDLTKDQIHKEYVGRQEEREQLEGYLIKANEEGDTEFASEILDSLQGELKPAFKELVYNKNYLSDLNSLYEEVNGEKFKGSKEELVKDSFDYWNGVEQNTTLGINELANSDYSDISKEGKKKLRRIFDVYYETDAFGAGSRDTSEQVYNLVTNSILDPANLLGVGVGAKVFRATAGKELMKRAIYTSLGIAAGGAVSGATADVIQQNVEMETRGPEAGQEYSPGRTAAVAGASALMPIAGKKIGQGVGSIARGITHPIQSAGKHTKAGKEQALLAEIQRAEDSSGISQAVVGNSERANVRTGSTLQTIWGDAGDSLKQAFDAVPKNDISINSLDRFMQKAEGDMFVGNKLPDSLKSHLLQAKSTATPGVAAALAGRRTPPKVGTYDTLKNMKQDLFNAAEADDELASHYMRLYGKLVDIEETAAVNPKQFKQMKEAYGAFVNIGKAKGDTVSKQLVGIAKAGDDNVSVPKKVDALITSFLDGKSKGVEQLAAVRKTIEKAQLAAEQGGVKNMKGAWEKFLEPVQTAVSERLMEKNNKLLFKLLDSKDGMKVLKELYPASKKDFENIQKLGATLGKGAGNKGSGSVIVNMTAARLASQSVGSAGGGQVSQAIASVAAVYGAQGMSISRLVENKTFRKAMVKAWKRADGRIDTKTMGFLKEKMGFTDIELGRLQDSLWTLFTTSPVIRAEETRKKINSIQY